MKIWPDPLNLDQRNPPLLNRLNANVLQRLYCTIEQNIIVLYEFSIYRQVLHFFMRNFVSADKDNWDLSAEQKLILFQTQKCGFFWSSRCALESRTWISAQDGWSCRNVLNLWSEVTRLNLCT